MANIRYVGSPPLRADLIKDKTLSRVWTKWLESVGTTLDGLSATAADDVQARAYVATDQSVPASTSYKLPLSTTYDAASIINETSDRITPGVAGVYRFHSQVRWQYSQVALEVTITIVVSGVTKSQKKQLLPYKGTTETADVVISDSYSLSASDYIEVYVSQSSAVDRTVVGDSRYSFITVERA